MESREIRQVFNYLENNQKHLTSSQFEFVKSLKKYFRWKGNLTPKQADCLINMRENIQIPVEQV